MSNFVVIFVFLGMGLLTQYILRPSIKLSLRLNQLTINIILPAVILMVLPKQNLNTSFLLPALIPWLLILISTFITLAIAKKYNWDKPTTGALLLMTGLGNTSYLGFPMVSSFLGSEYLKYAIIYDQIGNFIPLAIYGTAVISIFGSNRRETSLLHVTSTIIKFPPFLTLILVLAFKWLNIELRFPEHLQLTLNSIAILLTPTTMFIIGLNFSPKIDRKHHLAFCYGLSLKMLIMPIVALSIGLSVSNNQAAIIATSFEAAMPPMVTAAALALAANMQGKLCSSMVGIGLILSFFSLPLLAKLLQLL